MEGMEVLSGMEKAAGTINRLNESGHFRTEWDQVRHRVL
jgi:hypothetical protein